MEDGAVLAGVGEDAGLFRQVGAAAVDQGEVRQAVLPGDLLGPHVLARRHGVVGAALHRGIVGDDHAGHALDLADAGDDAGAGRHALVHVDAGQVVDLEEGRAGVQEAVDTVARQKLAQSLVAGAGLGVPGLAFSPPGHQCGHCLARDAVVGAKFLGADGGLGLDNGHGFFTGTWTGTYSGPYTCLRF